MHPVTPAWPQVMFHEEFTQQEPKMLQLPLNTRVTGNTRRRDGG
jgi:hypothetical protein